MAPLPMSAFSVLATSIALGNGYWLFKSPPMQGAIGKLVELEHKLERKLHLKELEELIEGKLHLKHLLHGRPSATELITNPTEIPKGTLQGVALVVLALVQLVLIWWLFFHKKGTSTPAEKMCKLQVFVEKAVKLPNTDAPVPGAATVRGATDQTDAYASITVGGHTVRTKTVQNNLNPVWETELKEFPIDPMDPKPPSKLVIEILDTQNALKDVVGLHGQSCGKIEYDLKSAMTHPAKEEKKTLPLQGAGTTASSTTVSDTTTSSTTTSGTTTSGTTTSGTTTSGTTTFGTTTSVSTTTDSTTVVVTTEETTTKPETTTEFVQPPCETACTEDWSAFEPCSHECWSTQEEFETIRKVRFKCYNSDAETCYETARCFTEENKDETECRDIEEIATGLSVTDLEALNLDGLGVLNVFVDFKIAITEKWLDDYSDPNSIQFNVKAAKYTGIMKSWFLFPATDFISLDAVSMTKVENGLECSQTGVPGVADEDALDASLEVTAEDITKNNPFIDTIGVDNRRRRDIDAAVTRALDQCEGSDLIVLHLRTRHQLVTTFDYNLITERMLRITGANSNATAFDADTIAQKTTDKLTENISTGKPQSTNGLNFRKFGVPRTTKQDVPILSQWSAWDDSGCPNGQSEKTRECVMNNAQTTPIDESECENSDAVKNLENKDYVAYRECCTDRENYSEEDDTQCICMYPWSADENGECNTCIALRPMQFLCYISGEFDNPPKESSATTTALSLIPLLTMLWLQLVN